MNEQRIIEVIKECRVSLTNPKNLDKDSNTAYCFAFIDSYTLLILYKPVRDLITLIVFPKLPVQITLEESLDYDYLKRIWIEINPFWDKFYFYKGLPNSD